MNKVAFKYYCVLMGLFVTIMIFGCNKETELGGGPYFDAPVSAVQFFGKKPNPIDGKAGDKVSFEITGLEKLQGYTFYVNQVQAEVVTVTDSLVTIIIPEGTSSGPASVLTSDGQYYYGPILKIDGKVSADATFKVGSGTNGSINTAYYTNSGNGLLVLGGSFTDFNNKSVSQKINGIVKIASDGSFVDYNAGKGAFGGSINSILYAGGQFYIGGIMSTYGNFNVDGLTRINYDCSLDSATVELVNADSIQNADKNKDTVPDFNAYLNGAVAGLFQDNNNNIIALGNFTQYYSYYYEGSQKDNYYTDRTTMYNFVRMDEHGKLDSSFNFDPILGYGKRMLNGYIADAIQLPDGKIIFVGSFTKYNGVNAAKIGALADDGSLDMAFSSNIGSGADGDIYKITYNKTTGKILITGDFTHYNGHEARGVAMLNADGAFDDSFKLREFGSGSPNYAGQLNNGKILISGTFSKYDNVVRQGFVILNADGSLAAGYNNTGSFSGQINGLIETSAHSVVIYGFISLFDNVKVGNIVRIAFD